MKYFQIRLPADCCLEHVLQEISKDIWLSMKDHFLVLNDYSANVYEQLQESINSRVMDHVHRFGNCGLAEECHDDIEGGPWVDYNEKIYMLAVSRDFDSYILETSQKVLDSLDAYLVTRPPYLHRKLSEILGRRLGKYLFYNPSCRRIPFCEIRLS